jgi:hypothetical protein
MMAATQRCPDPTWFKGWKDASRRGTAGILSAETLRKIHQRRGIPGVRHLGDGPRPRVLIDPLAFARWWKRWNSVLRAT